MTRLGLPVHECHGSAGWGGPAVTVPREQLGAVEKATTVKLEHHVVEPSEVMAYPAAIDPQTGQTLQEWLQDESRGRRGR